MKSISGCGEDGLSIDKLLLTSDSAYRPSGANPDVPNDTNNNTGVTLDNGGSAQPRLTIDSLDLDFGSVTVGESVTRQLVVENSGSPDLDISQVLLQGTAAASYQFSSAVPTRLAAGEQQAVNIVFTPLQVGEHVAIVSLLHDPDSSLTLVSLAGKQQLCKMSAVLPIPMMAAAPTGRPLMGLQQMELQQMESPRITGMMARLAIPVAIMAARYQTASTVSM